METTITATELARNLSDILNRVRYKGERFRVERNGEVIAVLGPKNEVPAYTVGDFIRDFGDLEVPPGFADALDQGRQVLRLGPEPPYWPP